MSKNLFYLLVCPSCGKNVVIKDETLFCDSCKAIYAINNNIPIMLYNQRNDVNDINKEKAKSQFITVAKSLEGNSFNKFIRFLNYGYIPNAEQKPDNRLKKGVFNRNQLQLLFELIGESELKGKTILDVGCGRGGNLQAISKYYQPKQMIGMDIAEASIQFCHERYSSIKHLNFIVADAEKIPFHSKCFDVVTNIESSYAYPNIYSFYDSVFNVLKNNGDFLYTDIFDVKKIESLEKYLEKIGFIRIRDIDITANVLSSLQQASKSFLASYDGLDDNDIEYFKEVSAIPGSNRFTQMVSREVLYKLYHWKKNG